MALFPNLRQLDITDEQDLMNEFEFDGFMDAALGPDFDDPQSIEYEDVLMEWHGMEAEAIEAHDNNEVRSEAAAIFFKTCPSLEYVCFVRLMEGCLYRVLRNADGTVDRAKKVQSSLAVRLKKGRLVGYNEGDKWRHGFPRIIQHASF